ncbi:Peptidyl-prolyl cis-trans isomerase cyp15 [Geranomyces variabilis]|uniref:peptidylprolyl isomerase n=1 Tax=Geranomyces variabilis TaxID=109894 RepID=A0AAD5TKU8_9FUNG|nr:Peptidyl-prolyl cis-trans isomerase cyp15 [Geranomyces variabilis]
MSDSETPRTRRPRQDESDEETGPTNGHAEAKRQKVDDDSPAAQDDESDDDVGPMPIPEGVPASKRKVRVLKHESLYLENIPSADMYERSLMHRDVVNFVAITKTDFLITTSVDGHVKFWKKTEKGLEFVKHFRSHLGAIVAIDVSNDGTLLATCGADQGLKIFDVVNFDMINMIKLPYLPNAVCWMYQKGQAQALLACSDRETSAIHLYDGRGGSEPLKTIEKLHSVPVHIMRYNPVADIVVSVDTGGMMEYWQPDAVEGFNAPAPPAVSWQYKSDTDLYEFKKAKAAPTSLMFSPTFERFVTYGFADRQLRIFNFRTGKVIRKYDESLTVVSEMQQAGTAIHHLDDMEFGRRLALEREIERVKGGQSATINAVFDESSNFVIYPTLLGIKVVNIQTNKVVRLIGKGENQRFMNVALYQGAPKKKGLITLEMAASDNPAFKESEALDPTLFCTAYKRNRFYCFSKREADSGEGGSSSGGRDIFNEKPSREEQTVAAAHNNMARTLGNSAIMHTTYGDIHIRLFPEYAPKAVENFVGLCKKGYYDNLIFHRVIKGFMIQTGDPFGDGTGGESLWGNDFEDEFHRGVKHDRPYTLSMANVGPNTNGSQFFITVVPTPWLDNKHTIFGRATGGMDVIHRIEAARCDKTDKPHEDIRIIGVEVR